MDFAKEIYNYGGVLGEKINGKGTVIFADDKIIPPKETTIIVQNEIEKDNKDNTPISITNVDKDDIINIEKPKSQTEDNNNTPEIIDKGIPSETKSEITPILKEEIMDKEVKDGDKEIVDKNENSLNNAVDFPIKPVEQEEKIPVNLNNEINESSPKTNIIN